MDRKNIPGRPKKYVTDSERKEARLEQERLRQKKVKRPSVQFNQTEVVKRWKATKTALNFSAHADLAKFLLDL